MHEYRWKKIVRCVRLLSDLKNEDSVCSELLRAINSFNCGEPRYDVPKKVSKKILSSVGIKYQGYFTMRFYGKKFCYGVRGLDLLLLELKNKQMPTIICDFWFSCWDLSFKIKIRVKNKSCYNIMHKMFTYYPKSEKFTCIYTTNYILYSLFGKIKINLSVYACTIFNFDGRKFLIDIEAYTKSKNKDGWVKGGINQKMNILYLIKMQEI